MDKKELLNAIAAIAEELKREHPEGSRETLKTDKELEIMMELSHKIVDAVLNNDLLENNTKGWASIIMLALGRATAIILTGLNHTHATGFMPADVMYDTLILPASLGIIQAHTEEMKKEKPQKKSNGTKSSRYKKKLD